MGGSATVMGDSATVMGDSVCVREQKERKHPHRICALSVQINHLKDDLNETNTAQSYHCHPEITSRDLGQPVTSKQLEQYLYTLTK